MCKRSPASHWQLLHKIPFILCACIESIFGSKNALLWDKWVIYFGSHTRPRFKLWWCQTSSEKIQYQNILKQQAKKYVTDRNSQDLISESPLEPPPKKAKMLFDFMAGPTTCRCSSSTLEDIDSYLSSSCEPMETDPAKYWKENENKYGQSLSMMAKDILSIPSSSAPVERLFSVAGRVFTPMRCRLTDKRFEQLMFISCNNFINK